MFISVYNIYIVSWIWGCHVAELDLHVMLLVSFNSSNSPLFCLMVCFAAFIVVVSLSCKNRATKLLMVLESVRLSLFCPLFYILIHQ